MVKMGITRSRSPGSFACFHLFLMMIVSVSIYTDMASATRWQDVCTLGDTYIERSIAPPRSCDNCILWCRQECSSFGTSTLKYPCNFTSYANPVDCQCCCSKRPSSSPQLPATPSSVGQFTGGDITNICSSEQTYLKIGHAQGTDCVLTPQCENKCAETGLLSAGSQCIGTSPLGDVYTWIEQCCCRTPPPPPPSPPSPPPSPPPPSPTPAPSPPPPSPPPPSPCPSPPSPGTCCGCCNSNINIQISVKSGCNVKVSTPPSSSAAAGYASI